MRKIVPALFLVVGLWVLAGAFPGAAFAQVDQPVITAPAAGDALQGVVSIEGTSQVDGFASTEISFEYSGDPTGTWFQIATSTQAVQAGVLASWDTTAISDGNYDLRLRVILSDGKSLEVMVTNLRVRNYTPVETPTPTTVVPESTPLPTPTLTPTPFFTPTAQPANPAALTTTQVVASIGVGGLAAVSLLLLLGLYVWLRRR